MNDFALLKQLVEENQNIVIYRHINGDYDAYGSQLGLKHILKSAYADKSIFCVGSADIHNPAFLDEMDAPDDETVRNSLAIVLDTSTSRRVNGDSFRLAKTTFRIDHHPLSEKVCDYEIIDCEASSASQLILEAAIANSWEITLKAARFLYAGISTDTVKLTIDKVDSRLFHDLSLLMKSGLNVNEINRILYDEDRSVFVAKNRLRTKIRFLKNSAYLYVYQKDLEKYGLNLDQAKSCIALMTNIEGVDKWATFIEDEDGTFHVSLRAHRIPISDIAIEYGGGGHLLASGVNPVSFEQTREILNKLADKE